MIPSTDFIEETPAQKIVPKTEIRGKSYLNIGYLNYLTVKIEEKKRDPIKNFNFKIFSSSRTEISTVYKL